MMESFNAVAGMEPAVRCFGISAAIDLTAWPRCGCRGPNAFAMLRDAEYDVPERANTAVLQENGELLARLSASEYLLLGNREADLDDADAFTGNRLKDAERFYRLERFDSHAWFVLTGSRCGDLMAKLCGVDLQVEASPAGRVVQTSVARINAIVIRQPLQGVDALNLLFDRSYATYFSDVLRDAMREYGGEFIDHFPGRSIG